MEPVKDNASVAKWRSYNEVKVSPRSHRHCAERNQLPEVAPVAAAPIPVRVRGLVSAPGIAAAVKHASIHETDSDVAVLGNRVLVQETRQGYGIHGVTPRPTPATVMARLGERQFLPEAAANAGSRAIA